MIKSIKRSNTRGKDALAVVYSLISAACGSSEAGGGIDASGAGGVDAGGAAGDAETDVLTDGGADADSPLRLGRETILEPLFAARTPTNSMRIANRNRGMFRSERKPRAVLLGGGVLVLTCSEAAVRGIRPGRQPLCFLN